MNERDAERFWIKVAHPDETGCRLWLGAKNGAGYGYFRLDGQMRRAHRVAYELVVGPIGAGLQLDHLCRVRACVESTHLEPVTARENTMRADTASTRSAAATHCPSGHPYDDENTKRDRRGWRACRTCVRAGDRERKRVKRARSRVATE